MPSSQHQGSTGLADTGNQFGQRQPRFHIPAHCVEDDQQSFDLRVLLNIHKLGDHMLVFGCFLTVRRQRMPFDGADDRQAVDGMPPFGRRHNAVLGDQIMFQPFERSALRRIKRGLSLCFLGSRFQLQYSPFPVTISPAVCLRISLPMHTRRIETAAFLSFFRHTKKTTTIRH